MLGINKQSDNDVNVVGILSELEVKIGTSKKGKDYVTVTAKVRVDQEINGNMTENEIPVKFMAMKKKSDGTDNPMYTKALDYREQFTSLAAADDPSQADRVSIVGRLSENSYTGQDGILREGWQIDGRFMNKAKKDEKEKATFCLTGVIGRINEEEKNGEPTGRLKVKATVVAWGGRADVINFIAEDSAKSHIESNWEVGDTVIISGRFAYTNKTETKIEEIGFGEPIEKQYTVSKREAIITAGSPAGLEEAISYDPDEIKNALAERKARLDTAALAAKNVPEKKPIKDFGF